MAAGKSSAGDGPADTPVTLDDVEAARGRLRGAIVETDCDFSRTLSEILGCSVWLKFENLQFTASFKERGALNRLSALSADERKRGVIAMSAGNHAQGVAYHASRLSIPSTIVMPVSTPTVKVVNTRRHGAEIILHGETVEEAASFARQYGRERNLTFIHPYDDPLVSTLSRSASAGVTSTHCSHPATATPAPGRSSTRSSRPRPTSPARRSEPQLVEVPWRHIDPRPEDVFVHHHTRVRDEPEASAAIGPAG